MNVIEVEHVWKIFRIPREKKNTIFETLLGLFDNKKKGYQEFVALKDINFSVRKGEWIGIIGPNGSGKSTLLILMSKEENGTTAHSSILILSLKP